MRIKDIHESDYYRVKENLLSEVDYDHFTEQAALFIKQFHDNTTYNLWNDFLKNLNDFRDKKSNKLLLMFLVVRCLELPLTAVDLAQLITLIHYLKEVYGAEAEIICNLLEAKVPTPDLKLAHFLTIFQLLIDLYHLQGISQEVNALLPDLQEVLRFLHKRQNDYLNSQVPQRTIDVLINGFVTSDVITQFPIKKEVLECFRSDYLAICSYFESRRSQSESILRYSFHEHATLWRESKIADAKNNMIAIMMISIYRCFNIIPYDTQIMSFLALLQNDPGRRIAQIKAGEGKSTIFAMLIAFKAAEGQFIDLITHSSYLAIRDFKKYYPFLQKLGLSSSHISHVNQKQNHFHAQILYGTNADFEFALLRDGLNQDKLRCSYRLGENQLSTRTFDTVFVDEVDNMMLDITGSARIAIPGSHSYSWIYEPIFEYVKNKIKNKRIHKETLLELKAYLQLHTPGKYHVALEKISNEKLLRYLHSAQIALYQKQQGRDYVVEQDIVIVDYANTGRKNEGCQWQHGIHQFLQVKHRITPTPESLTAASISHVTYFNKYHEIYGLTGTMGELIEREEIKEIYGVDSFDVPPHRPSLRITVPPKVCSDKLNQKQALFEEIKKLQKAGRPTLVLFETIMESASFSKYLKSKGILHNLLNETQRESEEYIISNAGKPKMVTVATNTAGRGTDILLSPESYDVGGLHQIFTFFPENSRVEEQGVSRAARQGKSGSSNMILRGDDPGILALLATSTSAVFQWVNAKTDSEKMKILCQLRSEKIFHESKHRRYISSIETLSFDYLNYFFQELAHLQQRFNLPELQTQLKEMCYSDIKETTCVYAINLSSKDWIPIVSSASLLLSNQTMGEIVDWSFFLKQFAKAFINHILENWSIFYSDLSHQIESIDSSRAKNMVQKSYDELNLSARCTSEVIKSTLAHVLFYSVFQKSKDQDENASASKSIGFFSPPSKALNLYNNSIQLIKEKKYQEALGCCESALELYRIEKGACSIEVGNCFSTSASCYRELNQFDNSVSACEASIKVFYGLNKKDFKQDKLTSITKKYNGCLEKSGLKIQMHYKASIALYKEGNYCSASIRLLFIINSNAASPLELGHCYSTLASCYRDMKEIETAGTACRKAIEQFQNAKITILEKQKLIQSTTDKLDKLMNKLSANY